MYKGAAKHRKLEFAITLEQFMQFWQSKCYYCNDTIERAGLDRIDNERGYTLDNIISCCAICNRMKYTHSQDVFVMQCLKIAAKHGYIKLDDLLPPYKKDK